MPFALVLFDNPKAVDIGCLARNHDVFQVADRLAGRVKKQGSLADRFAVPKRNIGLGHLQVFMPEGLETETLPDRLPGVAPDIQIPDPFKVVSGRRAVGPGRMLLGFSGIIDKIRFCHRIINRRLQHTLLVAPGIITNPLFYKSEQLIDMLRAGVF